MRKRRRTNFNSFNDEAMVIRMIPDQITGIGLVTMTMMMMMTMMTVTK